MSNYNNLKEIGVNDSQLTKEEIYGDKADWKLTYALIPVIEFEDGTHCRVFQTQDDAEQYALILGSSGDVISIETENGLLYAACANEIGVILSEKFSNIEHIGCCYG